MKIQYRQKYAQKVCSRKLFLNLYLNNVYFYWSYDLHHAGLFSFCILKAFSEFMQGLKQLILKIFG